MSDDAGPLRILLAEDDPDQRLLVRTLFDRAGYPDVVDVADGAAAVEAAREHRPDLVVLDLAMPARSGFEILPEVRDLVPDAAIVILSNFPRWRLAGAARQRGAVGYVEKRTPPDRLVGEILIAAALAERAAATLSSRLGADAAAPRSARHLVRGILDGPHAALVGDTELLVSELVTNAVVHGSSAPRIQVFLEASTVRIEVHDDDPRLPRRRRPDPDTPGGRGLLLLDRIAARWGADPTETGKVVWFELDR